jgi:REP element-mobilizing transposase RayT
MLSDIYKVDIIAYALMAYHIHLFVFDQDAELSNFIEDLHGQYAQYYNKVAHRTGHVFGERFNNKIVQPNNYGVWLTRYIHRQAVEAGIVNDPQLYAWTSYHVYIGMAKKGFLKPAVILEQFGQGKTAYDQYKNFVMNENTCPVDWNQKSISMVGDPEFIKNFHKAKNIPKKTSPQDMLELASTLSSMTPEVLLNPCGWRERRLRQKILIKLFREYDYSISEIARVFKITPTAVRKAIRSQVRT